MHMHDDMVSPSSSKSPAAVPLPPKTKPIRFVNTEGHPPAKRRRINAACQTCRKRKIRCDGTRPLCKVCKENGHECLGYGEGVEVSTARKPRKASEDAGVKTDSRRPKRSHGVGQVEQRSRPPERRGIGDAEKAGQGEADIGVYKEAAVFDYSPDNLPENRRVPYFRYFGPTAIVPGFKQMVVSVRDHHQSAGTNSSVSISEGSNGSIHGSESKASVDMPTYNKEDTLPVNRLIIHLVETFFAHVGSNYSFLQRKALIQGVEERTAEPILVNTVCALAARFSDHPLLVGSHDSSYPKSAHGCVFARRAKAAVVDTFPYPTIAAVQACLLLAYESFGANQDSALWMYLGCAIRMATDLGLHKLDGMKHQGQMDPMLRRFGTDTFWSVFILDRIISSGTGRPVTLRTEDLEISFPALDDFESGWPNPFPALVHIFHMYGQVSDLLNNIKDVSDVTPEKTKGLAVLEKDLTHFYQKLDAKLTFNASNFHHYVKIGNSTNFILVHFWFHTLIMLLHQPTLMHSFEGPIQQLLPNSRELSMSSAKTIADILAFAELIDPRSFVGNPFTSQPIYIAACAFLKETAAHTSQPSSRGTSPPRPTSKTGTIQAAKDSRSSSKAKTGPKHSLLASAANQNYQRCYKALQQLETYWAGIKYILVALDQKAKGIWDPETFTEQDFESTRPRSAQDMIPNWRRKLPLTAPSPGRLGDLLSPPTLDSVPGSPQLEATKPIGWSLTGTTNSPSSNVTFMYQNKKGEPVQQAPSSPLPPGTMIYDPIRGSLPESTSGSTATSNSRFSSYSHAQPRRHNYQSMAPPTSKYPTPSDAASRSDAEMLLGLQHSPFPNTPGSRSSFDSPGNPTLDTGSPSYGYPNSSWNMAAAPNSFMGLGGVGDMMMESQDIDMSTMGGEMMPWLEYLPQDVLSYFDGGGSSEAIPTESESVVMSTMSNEGD